MPSEEKNTPNAETKPLTLETRMRVLTMRASNLNKDLAEMLYQIRKSRDSESKGWFW